MERVRGGHHPPHLSSSSALEYSSTVPATFDKRKDGDLPSRIPFPAVKDGLASQRRNPLPPKPGRRIRGGVAGTATGRPGGVRRGRLRDVLCRTIIAMFVPVLSSLLSLEVQGRAEKDTEVVGAI